MSTANDDLEVHRPRPVGIDTRRPRRIAIVGGGLAGLTAALKLIDLAERGGLSVAVTLFEASDRLGGAIETVHEGDYLIERGADAFLKKPAMIRLCERLKLTDDLLPTAEQFRGSLVLRNGRPVRVPEGFNLMAPAKLWPILATPILSPAGKLRLLSEAVIPARRETSDESLADFVRRRLGQEALDRLVQPLVAGIYTADPEKLSLAATLPRFVEMEKRHGSLIRALMASGGHEPAENASGARYSLFVGLRGGMEQLFAALQQAVASAATIRTGTAVGSLRRTDSEWLIAGSSGDPLGEFDAVVLAVPAFRAASLLTGVDETLASDLRRIPYASSAIVVTGHPLDEVSHPLDAFGLVIPTIEEREVLAVSFASRKFPGRAPGENVLIRTFVGGAMRPEILSKSDDELIALVRRELASLLGVSGRPDVALVSRHSEAMPQYHIGHLDLVAKIEAATARQPGLELTGSAYRGVGMPDVVADAERAAESVIGSAVNG